MLKPNYAKPWNRKTGAITALVALVGMGSILYSANIFLDNQFVSATIDQNYEQEERIYPWITSSSEQTTAINQEDIILSKVVSIENRISEIDDMILQNLRSGISDPSLFEEKADLLTEIGQLNKALPYYQEAFDLDPQSNIQEKILRIQTTLDRIDTISNHYS